MQFDHEAVHLLSRYLSAAAVFVPLLRRRTVLGAARQDIIRSAESVFEGRSVSARELEQLLSQYGSPQEAAERFGNEPRGFTVRFVSARDQGLLLLLWAAAAAAFVVGLLFILFFSCCGDERTFVSVVRLLFAAAGVFAAMWLIMILIGRSAAHSQDDPLPRAVHPAPYSLADQILSLITALLLILLLTLFIGRLQLMLPAASACIIIRIFQPAFYRIIPLLVIRLVLDAILAAAVIAERKERGYVHLVRMLLSAYDAALACIFLSGGYDCFFSRELFIHFGIPVNEQLLAGLYSGILLLAVGLNIAGTVRKAVRLARNPLLEQISP
jgi:hypothetical protein